MEKSDYILCGVFIALFAIIGIVMQYEHNHSLACMKKGGYWLEDRCIKVLEVIDETI